MRAFADLAGELDLKPFIDSANGSLWFVEDARGLPVTMVRRFDRDLPPSLVPMYVDLIRATSAWITAHPELAQFVRVEEPTEVGSDFIARPYHLYYTSTRTYTDWDDPPSPPEQLTMMRSAAEDAFRSAASERDDLLTSVLSRSLLRPSGKTYYKDGEGRFEVVEPVMFRADLERWARASDQALPPA